jgi:hypothetical protein
MRQAITEAYHVRLGRGKLDKFFDSLQAAVDFINDGMKNRDAESFVLYNDNKEMIWLDYYRERDGHGLGYTVSSQNDKSVVFDKQSGLTINNQKDNDEQLRAIVVQEAGRMKYYREAQKFAKLRFVNQTSESSYIDFEEGCVYYNKQEQLNDAIESLVKQLRSKTESLETAESEQLNEIFGLGKKSKKKRYIVGITADTSRTVYTAELSDFIEKQLKKKAEVVKLYRGPRYFPYSMLRSFEFVCEEQEFERIKRYVLSTIRSSDFTATKEYGAAADHLVNNLIKWGTLGAVKESIEVDDTLAESWYLQEW